MRAPSELCLVAVQHRPARCAYCRQPIEWATLAGHGKAVPLVPRALEYYKLRDFESGATGVKFNVVDVEALHASVCRHRRRVAANRAGL